MKYQSFKNRKIDLTKSVKVYKNLHNGLLSVSQDGKVVAHVTNITLSDVEFKVSLAGRNRVIKEKKKNVHAFCMGMVTAVNAEIETQSLKAVTYNPYKYSSFVFKDSKQQASLAAKQQLYCCSNKGLFVA